ncbi:hypothetical protein TruAng_003001 [Truncatella angustata]|nr:hypothetical protein TruAng_003001 [Truncatella angustata]
MSSFPSIQSFYKREIVGKSGITQHNASNTNDGFTSQEVSDALHPLSRPWRPNGVYRKCPIASIEAGPCSYEILGRVVNFSSPSARNHAHSATEGQYRIVLSDENGAIAVKLFYTKPRDFTLVIGQTVTIYTAYIANSTKAETGHIPYVHYCTIIHPSRNRTTHIIFHQDLPLSDEDRSFRAPLELNTEQTDNRFGLMSLKTFLSSGFDTGEGTILVCVRSIGPHKSVRSRKREGTVDLIEVSIFDDTAASVLKLWGDHISCARSLVPNQRILWISHPNYKTLYGHLVCADVEWLRKKAKELAKKESVLNHFPEGIWDVEATVNSTARELLKIAEMDENIRQDLESNTTDKLNVIISEVNLMAVWHKGMLCCTECCGIPLYANKPLAI